MDDQNLDILSLKNECRQLKKMVLRYQIPFENSRDAINIFSMDRKILEVNKALIHLSGYSRKDLLKMHLNELYPETLSMKVKQRLRTLKNGQKLPLFETVLQTRAGKNIPVEFAVTVLKDWNGPETICQGNVRDISEKKKVLNRLTKSEEKYRSLIENIDAGVARSTPGMDGKYIEVNPSMVNLLGYSKKELFTSNLYTFLENKKIAGRIENELAHKSVVRSKEIGLRHRDGSTLLISYTAKSIKDKQGRILYKDEIIVDIAPRKIIEEEIQKNEKLKSIGALAGGIAHHFNNIMTGLFGNLSLARLELEPDSPVLDYLTGAEECMQEGISLTKQLLTFAKGGDPIKSTLDIAELVKDAVIFSLSGSNIRLSFTAEDDLWQIKADKSQISQVISNIVMNARQAMPDGGQLSVHIEKSDFLKDNLLTIAKERYLKLTIKDNGDGIPQKNLEQIFDPYFTTREDGSGMGLSICYSIIKKHDGHIFVSSQVGLGTTITVYLPALSTHKSKDSTMQNPDPANNSSTSKRILIMDDEDHIRNLLQKMLEKFGYHVELSADGEEAVEKYKTLFNNNTPPDLVIMDLTIPGGMGGKEASEKILEFDPDARVIVSSGYSNDPVMANFESYGLKGIIPKPYRMQELKTAVESILST